MTTELEMNFFQCFGIEKRKKGYCDWDSWCPYEDLTCGNDCPYWKYDDEQYPEITDRKYLELICLYLGYERLYIGTFELDHFKRFILSLLIDLYKETIKISSKERLKQQVKALFENKEQ